MITQAPRKEITLDYALMKVKETINSTFRLAGQRLLDKNDVLNTYRIALVHGLNTAILTIQLNKVEENKTSCLFEIFNTVDSGIQPATLTGMMDKYLQLFTDLLTGKLKVVEKTQTQIAEERKKSNKFLIYLIIGGIAFVILFLLFLKR